MILLFIIANIWFNLIPWIKNKFCAKRRTTNGDHVELEEVI